MCAPRIVRAAHDAARGDRSGPAPAARGGSATAGPGASGRGSAGSGSRAGTTGTGAGRPDSASGSGAGERRDPGSPRASRRSLLGAGLAAAGAAFAAGPGAGRAAARSGAVLDLTHPLSANLPVWPGNPPFAAIPVAVHAAGGFAQQALAYWEHTGTHVDAPLHRIPGASGVDRLAPADLVAPLVVLDIRAAAAADPDAAVTIADIDAWRARHGDLPERAFVAALTGWEAHLADPARFTGLDAAGVAHTPGFSAEAAAHLVGECGAVGVGIDTLSLDRGAARDHPAHTEILGAGRYGVEMLANLASAPAAGATVVVGAPAHVGGTGGPARVLALT